MISLHGAAHHGVPWAVGGRAWLRSCWDTPERSLRQNAFTALTLSRPFARRSTAPLIFTGPINGSNGANGSPRHLRRRRGRRANPLSRWRKKFADAPLSARKVAIWQLLRIDIDMAYVGLVGGSIDKPGRINGDSPDHDEGESFGSAPSGLSERDARLVKTLVSGVTRSQRKLDFILSKLSRVQLKKLDPPLLQVLRVGLFQLTELQAPHHAMDGLVELTKAIVRPQAASFANALFRAIVARLSEGNLPDPKVEDFAECASPHAELLGTQHSHPTWLVERWVDQFGEAATIKLMRWNNTPPIHGLRVHQRPGAPHAIQKVLKELSSENVDLLPSQYLPNDFLRVASGLQSLIHAGILADGHCSIQDEAAGLVVRMLDPQPGESVLDCCAAPGGKALFAASLMMGKGSLLALDVSPKRLQLLKRSAEAQGLSHMLITQACDLRQFSALNVAPVPAAGGTGELNADKAAFDRVLVDAPCSGTGVLAKRADLRWQRLPGDITQMAGLQGELLDAASALVKPGGLLVYSTCSIEREENQGVVEAFLLSHTNFELERPPEGLVPQSTLAQEGYLATAPFRHGIDGAFAARLRRRNSEQC